MYEFNERVSEITGQLKSNLYWIPEQYKLLNHISFSDVMRALSWPSNSLCRFCQGSGNRAKSVDQSKSYKSFWLSFNNKVQTKAVLSLPILTKTTSSWLAVHTATNILREKIFKQTIADIFIELKKRKRTMKWKEKTRPSKLCVTLLIGTQSV